MSKLNLINVSSADASLDSKKADKASVNASMATVEKASDASTSFGSLNGKVDTNSASNAKTFTSLQGTVNSLAGSLSGAIGANLQQINNLDVTNDKIQALRNLMHDAHYNTPKVIAMATSLTSDIQNNKAAVTSLDSAKEAKADNASALNSLQSSASTHADSVANSVAASDKTALNVANASLANANQAITSLKGNVTSLANANTSLTNDMNQVISALSTK